MLDKHATANAQFSSELAARDKLRHILTRLRASLRYAWVGAIVAIIFLAGSVFVAMKSKRTYTSRAVLLYRQMIQGSDIGTERHSGSFLDLGAQLQELLLTRPRLTKVIKEYQLYPKTVATRGYGPAVEELRQNLQIRLTAGDTIHLQFSAPTADVAQAVVAWLTNSIIEEENRLRTEQARVTVKFIEGELKRASDDLTPKEEAQAKFLAAHPEFIAENSTPAQAMGSESAVGTSMRGGSRRPRTAAAGARSGSGDTRLLALERQAARIRAQLTGGTPPAEPAAAPVDPARAAILHDAEQEVQAATRNLADLSRQYTEIHPSVRAARQRLAEAQAQLRRVQNMNRAAAPQVRPVASSVDKEELSLELTKILRQIEARRRNPGTEKESEKAADDVVSLELEWSQLSRDVSEGRSRVLTLEGRLFRARLSMNVEQSGQASHMEVIDPAFLPTHPSGKGRTTVVIIGFGAGCFLAGMLVLLLGFLDVRIYDRTDVLRVGTVPLLIVVPRMKASKRGARKQDKPEKQKAGKRQAAKQSEALSPASTEHTRKTG